MALIAVRPAAAVASMIGTAGLVASSAPAVGAAAPAHGAPATVAPAPAATRG